MRKTLASFLFIFFFAGLFSQSIDPKNIRIGGGLYYATSNDNIGILLNGTYEITEQWETALTFSHIFENDYTKHNILDIDAHYVFFDDDFKVSVFGLAGLSLNFWKTVWPPLIIAGITVNGETITNGTDFGLNLGLSMSYDLNDVFSILPEIKATISDESFIRIGLMLQYKF
jgi:hypothetical protein